MPGRARTAASIVAVLAVAAALRLVGADLARDGAGRLRPRLDADGDVLYHAARARHLVARGEVLWVDPGLNPPRGAPVLWPPLLEGVVAGAAWVAAGGAPGPADVDAAAAVVPVALGLLGVAAAGVLGLVLLGPGHALLSALALAVSWTGVFYAMIGRTDQHVLEQALFLAALAALAAAVRAPSSAARRRRTLVLGAVLAATFWAWQGSALTLLVLALAAAVDHVAAPPGEPASRRASTALAEGALAGGLLLAISIALLGAPGALGSGAVQGVSGLGVAACLATSLGAGLLALAGRRARPRAARVAEAAAAAGLAAGALLAVPALRAGVLHGLAPLARANPWYDVVHEFRPVFVGGRAALREDARFALFTLGLFPLLAIVGAWAAADLARKEPARRTGLVLLGTAAVSLTSLWLARRRFDLYAVVPLLALAAAGARRLATRVAAAAGVPRRAGALALALVLAAALPTLPGLEALAREQDPAAAPVLRIAGRLAPAAARDPAGPGVLLCSWAHGHHARFASGVPALVTPFGSDAGADAMEDWARFMTARDDGAAAAALAARDVRWLLLEPLLPDLLLAHRLAPSGPPPVEIDARGAIVPRPEGADLVAVRLYWRDGNGAPGAPSLDAYRLVDEDAAGDSLDGAAKLFERVAGARVSVSGAPPGARVEARVSLRLPTGRRSFLALAATADATGHAPLRLPYATGANGRVEASGWTISSGGVSRTLAVEEAAVARGAELALALR